MTAPAKKSKKLHHLFLIDGSGYIFRAYYAIQQTMTRPDGTPVNAVFGFANMLHKLLSDAEVDGIAVIFDSARKTFRNDIYPDYKANRSEPPEDLIPQFPLVRDATRAFNVPAIDKAGFEADDLIATYAKLAREQGIDVTIISSDKDLMQLVGPGVDMRDPMKNREIGPEQVLEKFGVPPEKVIDVQALAGDSVDNVPGVPGIGVKTAAQLINEYGDLDSLLARAEEIKQTKRRENLIEFAEQARLSRRLVTLKNDVPLDLPLEDLTVHEPDHKALRAFLLENNFKSIITRLRLDEIDEGEADSGVDVATDRDSKVAYELVQDLDGLRDWVEAAFAQGFVAVDTETTSIDAMRAELVGVSLALAPGTACYIPLGHRAPQGNGGLDLGGLDLIESAPPPVQIPRDEALKTLKPLLEDAGVLKIGQNIKYDMTILARQAVAIAVAPIDDTMLLSYVLEGGLHGHGMDELAELHLDYTTIKFKEVAGTGKAQVTFDQVPLDKARDYAAEDADITLRLHQAFKPRLVTERMTTVYETIERPLAPVLAAMERQGIKIDRDALRRLSNDFAKRLSELEAEIHKLAGRPFTIGSPKQLGEILFDEMGIAGGKKGKSGAYATGADILEGLAAQGHDLPARVLDWRQLAKLKSTYTDALQEQVNPDTGRIHTSFAQAVASTGRLSSSDPNLQNIPIRSEEGRKIRHAFIAEAGHKLLSVDYSQIELRLAAHIAEVEPLRQAFHDGLDIHAMTAAQVFDLPVEGMDPMIRRRAKAINFGIIYGISAFGLAQQLGIPQGEARAYIEAYFERYPGIRAYMEATKELCRAQGYVSTLFGRRIYVPGIADKNPARRNFSERAAINAPIQGAAADIIKRAMIRIPRALADAKLKARMLLQVHDELLFEVPNKEIAETTAVVRAVMETANAPAVELSVPLVADAGIGDNWAEAH